MKLRKEQKAPIGRSKMPEVHALETVSLREAWPDEARHFTPWMANHLELLGAALALDLEQAQAILTGAGRVDILVGRPGQEPRW